MYSLLLPRVQFPGVVQLLRLGGCIHSKVPQLAVGIDGCQLSQAGEVGGKQCACTCTVTSELLLLMRACICTTISVLLLLTSSVHAPASPLCASSSYKLRCRQAGKCKLLMHNSSNRQLENGVTLWRSHTELRMYSGICWQAGRQAGRQAEAVYAQQKRQESNKHGTGTGIYTSVCTV